MKRLLFPLFATFALLAGCAADTEPAPDSDGVHVTTGEEVEMSPGVTPQLRCRSGKTPTPMTCCDVSDGCTRKYRCYACDI